MNSGEDVDAFQAALDRDIGGYVPNSQPSDAVTGTENNAQKAREVKHQLDSQGMQVGQVHSSTASIVNQEREHLSSFSQGKNIQRQQHLHFPQTSFPLHGRSGISYCPSFGTPSGAAVKPQPRELQMMQVSHHQSLGTTQLRGTSQAINMASLAMFLRQNSVNDASKVRSDSISHYANKSGLHQTSVPWQALTVMEQNSTPCSSTNYVKQEPIDQASEQNKSQSFTMKSVSTIVPVEQENTVLANIKDESRVKQSSKVALSLPAAKVDPVSVPHSITAQLGLNNQLGSRMPTASLAGVNTKTPNKNPSVGQKKLLGALGSSPPLPSKKQKVSGAFLDQSIEQLNDVTAVSGINIQEEEEQLFSVPKDDDRVSEASRMVVQEEEERLILQKAPLQNKLANIMAKCGLKNISNDMEQCLSLCVEERIRGLISSLIRLSKQRVDTEKARCQTIITSDVQQQIMSMKQKARKEWEKMQADAEKVRKINKANKEEDDKMRTTAANIAAHAAIGGDDMLSKWQLMAEQARQNVEEA